MIFSVSKDGEFKFKGSRDECFEFLARNQSSSTLHALRYEGWVIHPILDAGEPLLHQVNEWIEAFKTFPSYGDAGFIEESIISYLEPQDSALFFFYVRDRIQGDNHLISRIGRVLEAIKS